METEQLREAEEEERRVFYVGMTRAERRLILSGATDFARWPEPRPLAEPMTWIWRGVAPGLRAAWAEGAGSGELVSAGGARVAFRVLGPATLDEVLPPHARRPEPPPPPAPPTAEGGEGHARRTRSGTPRPEAHDGRPRRPIPPGRGRAGRHAPRPGQLSLFGRSAGVVPPEGPAAIALAGSPPAAGPLPMTAVAAPSAAWAPAASPAPPPSAAQAPAASASAVPFAAPSVAAPEVARLSYSALEEYARCPYRFYLERVLELPPPPKAASPRRERDAALPARARGTIVHELLERVPARPHVPSTRDVEGRLRAHGLVPRPSAVEDLRRLVAGWIESDLFDRVRLAERVRTELAFRFLLRVEEGPEILVDGVLDVHATRADGHVLVVDHKTDRLDGREPEHVVAGAYATQRLVYALAALRGGAERVEVAHCFLERPDRPALASFGRAERADVESRLARLAAGAVEGRWSPTDDPHRELCGSCPGRSSLCSHPPERTLSAVRSTVPGCVPTTQVRDPLGMVTRET
jgi:hypothetical protein